MNNGLIGALLLSSRYRHGCTATRDVVPIKTLRVPAIHDAELVLFRGSGRGGSRVPPQHPRAIAPGLHAIERYLVFERIHAAPEAVPSEGGELALDDQTLKRLLHQLVALMNVVKNLAPQREEAAVDQDPLIRDRANVAD